MKTLKITIIFLLTSLTMVSCDFLEKEPNKLTPDNYFNTEEEASSFLTGIYAILAQPSFYGSDYMYLAGGDDLSHYGGSGRPPATRGLICNNALTSDVAVTQFWYVLYSGINRANVFLENIDKVEKIDTDTKAQYIAEARFLRAFFYFNLVQCWGDVPFKTSSTQGVIGLDIPRTSKQVIYDFIVSEMDDAAELGLKSASDLAYKPGRISQSTAWGMLARVYLFRAGEYHREKRTATQAETKDYYGKASLYGQKVMAAGHELAPRYWDYFIDLCAGRYNSTGNESIWEAEFAGNNTSDIQAEGRIGNLIGISAPDLSSKTSIIGKKDPGYAYAFIYSTPKLYNLYMSNKDTQRFNWSIAPFAYRETKDKEGEGVTFREFEKGKKAEVMSQYGLQSYQYEGDIEKTTDTKNYSIVCGKYRREYEPDKKDKNYTAINFPILRYADVLLMIAEAENQINNGPTALAERCINLVRNRAGLTDIPKLQKDDFLQRVKDERAMELSFEYTRRFDLIRWGEYKKNMQALVSEAQSGTNWTLGPTNVYTYFNISDTYNYFPIPDAELSVNKAITQNNPGW